MILRNIVQATYVKEAIRLPRLAKVEPNEAQNSLKSFFPPKEACRSVYVLEKANILCPSNL